MGGKAPLVDLAQLPKQEGLEVQPGLQGVLQADPREDPEGL